ncbi:MAG: hypothetical protein ACTTJS_08355 [Wolinella sp.]
MLPFKKRIANPQLIGRGSFKEPSRLRHTIVTSFDFDNLEVSKKTTVETFEDGFNEVAKNPDEYEIRSLGLPCKNIID